MNMVPIGWVGLGNMGTAIVKNLLKNDLHINVYNRTKEKESDVLQAGAISQQNLQQLVHNSSIIFTMLSDDEAVKDVYAQLLSHTPSGKIFVDMSTVSPETSRLLAERCSTLQNNFIDAPVSGSVKPAEEGTLIIMAGGSEEAFEKVKPLFEIIGKLALHVGENGSGSSAKLAINYLLGLNLQGLAETVLFARDNGIKTDDMLTIVNEGALANGITKGKASSILNNTFPAAFALKHLAKDLRLAGAQGLQAPLFQPLLHTFQEALQSGLGEEDVMAIFKYLQDHNTHSTVTNIYPDDNVSDYAN
ncbi:MAG TPA: NAD(P)-dependent oxidoreductase [Segetibacter sp.]|nr:NAD(P)-dependent oxidoreductase [Segetibacter sp.]